ncbi:TonB-dependent receptor plug domain-containing protein [Marinifilum fragile]|uniref:TonB-dependent receptor plug domain-containing protein n=1 Tax=Marinifilum fragile TaxID=570161 RepID=UPI0006D11E64|nr:TonB-dependent receptor plug domain-containing protein [Marinifilum fragile]
MKLKKVIFLLALSQFIFLFTKAQTLLVTGKVVVFDSIPVVNANVIVKSTKETVKTNHLGVFKCECNEKDKLIVIAKGFNKYTIKVKKKSNELIGKLKLAKIPKAEEIAINKGHILMIESFKELAKKYSGQKDYSKYTSFMDIIRNEFPTLQISNGEIIIRGKSSFYGSSAANIEIDGVMTDYSALSNISPTNIAKIEIIKGSDAAIYGVRGGNGVVKITTKK